MKKTIALLLAGLLTLGLLTACGPTEPQSTTSGAEPPQGSQAPETAAPDHLSRIQAAGKLVVAMEGTWSPWTYHDESDTLVGYDVEVSQAIAEKLGVDVEFVEGEFDGLFAGMEAGRYDIVVNGVDIDEERAEKYDFSTPYAYNQTAVIVAMDNDEITSFEDLAGKHTANTITSTYAKVAEKYGATVTGVDDLAQTFELLLTGRIDATLNSEMTFYDYMNAHPDEQIKIAVLGEATQTAIPVLKGDDNATLLAAINKALAELAAEGKLTELSNKYFGRDISQDLA